MVASKLVVLALLLLALIAAGFFILNPEPTSEANGFDRVSVRLKWLHQAQFAGVYYAQEAGFYKSEGLDVEINEGGVDYPSVQMVASGSDDFGITSASSLLMAREKKIPVVGLAVIYRKTPSVFFALNSSNITTPKDFEGKSVGIKYGSEDELVWNLLVQKTGINISRVDVVPVKYYLTPFFAGSVDVWTGYAINELIAAQEKGFNVTVINPNDYGIELYDDTIINSERTLPVHPDVVNKFVRATLKGWEEAATNWETAVEYTLKYQPKTTSSHETKMLVASIPLIVSSQSSIGWIDQHVLNSMQDLLLSQEQMHSKIDVRTAFTNEFVG